MYLYPYYKCIVTKIKQNQKDIPKLAPLHIIQNVYIGQTDKPEFIRLLDWLD